MSQTVRIIAAVVNQSNLVLYQADGKDIVIPQGDPRIKRILDKVIVDIENQQYSDVDLSLENPYTEFEKRSKNKTKFYRISRVTLQSLLGQEVNEKEEMVIGEIPPSRMQNAVAEIMAHAAPASSPEFKEDGVYQQGDIDGAGEKKPASLKSSHTIVAVVEGKGIVANMELIRKHIALAGSSGNTLGLETLINRMASMTASRGHSVEDLLRFLERSDLPIADDGCIVIYKVLRYYDDSKETFVDPHTRKVKQSVGSRVFMAEHLVDPNRRNECSNGLHVARRSYIHGFSGDLCVIAKLNPEDVIAVPEYDANKMRVCGYNILEVLTEPEYKLLRDGKPITNIEIGAKRLARILAGNHVGITQTTEIGGNNGSNLSYKTLSAPRVQEQDHGMAQALPNSAKGTALKVAPVDVKKVKVNKNNKTELKVTTQNPVSYRERIAKLVSIGVESPGVLSSLLDLKKQAKKSWEALGVDAKTIKKIAKLTGQ